jgi:hypothetical protein
MTPVAWALSITPPSSHRAGQHLVGRVLVAIAQDVDESDHVVTNASALAARLGGIAPRQVGEAIRILRSERILVKTRYVAAGTEHKIDFGWHPDPRMRAIAPNDPSAIAPNDQGHSTPPMGAIALIDDPQPALIPAPAPSIGVSSYVVGDSVTNSPLEVVKKHGGRAKPRRAVPDDLLLTAAMRDYATEKGPPGYMPELEFETFKDWHRAHGSKMADWPAAWRTWVQKAARWASGPGPGSARVAGRGSGIAASIRDVEGLPDFS